LYRSLLPIMVLVSALLGSSVPTLAQWRYIKTYPDLKLSQVEYVREPEPAIKGIVWDVGTGPAEGVSVGVTDEGGRAVGSMTLGFIPVSGSASFTVPIQGIEGTHTLTVTATTESGTDLKPKDNSQTIVCPLPGIPFLTIILILVVIGVAVGVGYYFYQTSSRPKRPSPGPPRPAPQ